MSWYGHGPHARPFVNHNAPGFTLNTEFNIDPQEVAQDTPDRDAVVGEQERICTIFNQYLEAQKLKILGYMTESLPSTLNEQSNRQQLQSLIRDMADANVKKVKMQGIYNSFGEHYVKLMSDKLTVDEQKRLNEIDFQRLQGMPAYPAQLRGYALQYRSSLIIYAVAAFSCIWTIASLGTVLNKFPGAGTYFKIECAIFTVIMAAVTAWRHVLQWSFVNTYDKPPVKLFAKIDRMFADRLWDWGMVGVSFFGIAMTIWLWYTCDKKLQEQKDLTFVIPTGMTLEYVESILNAASQPTSSL